MPFGPGNKDFASTSRAFICSCAFFSSCGSRDIEVPPAVASSRYITYHTWAYPDGLAEEGAVVCMDDKLAEMDRFIEFVATTLEIDVPADPIHYVWVPPERIHEDTWICSGDATGCFEPNGPGGSRLVYSIHLDLFHELVHAVELPALGRSHPVFEEGMAAYLSTAWSSANVLEEFPSAFKGEIGPGQEPAASLSMHFVGALIAHGGLLKYKAFRGRVAYDDGFPEIAAAYEAVYGESLERFLTEASTAPVVGLGASSRCVGPPTVPWNTLGALDATLPWACGDGATFGIAETFGMTLAIDVPETRHYLMTLSAVDGGPVLSALLDTCPDGADGSSNAINSANGHTSPGVLEAGRYTLSVSLKSGPEKQGALRLVLE